MAGYFSFDKMITRSFVKVLYFLGFLALTGAGIALATWAGMRLHDASIPRQIGWQYVAVGAGVLLIGNLVWRITCELLIVLFNIHARMVSIDRGAHFEVADQSVRREVIQESTTVGSADVTGTRDSY